MEDYFNEKLQLMMSNLLNAETARSASYFF